jgi:hypothetical protein
MLGGTGRVLAGHIAVEVLSIFNLNFKLHQNLPTMT